MARFLDEDLLCVYVHDLRLAKRISGLLLERKTSEHENHCENGCMDSWLPT